MGEVYRAEDTRLGRQVTIKVSSDLFARDPERLARFEREAKVLASLNHPNLWAFGYALYECLTGKRAFQFGTKVETVAAILMRESDWQALPRFTETKASSSLSDFLLSN
jgi:serine/threonine protein kinase